MQETAYFIDVILPIPLERLFTYRVTKAEFEFLKKGIRVAVPFGKRKIYTALVYNFHHNSPEKYEAKDIHQILDDKPIVAETQLQLWSWMSSYYMCTLGEVIRAALPSAFLLESESIIKLNSEQEIEDSTLKDDEFLVVEALQYQSSLKVDDICNILDLKNVLPVLKRLIDKYVIAIEETLYQKYKPKLIRYVKIHENYDCEEQLNGLLEKLKRAPKQSQIILSYFTLASQSKKPIKVSELLKLSQASSAQIKALIDKSILEEYYLQTDRVLFENSDKQSSKQLNISQENALSEITKSYKIQNVTLLKGVTSSGKTEIYVKLIEAVLKEEKQVLYLVPEIALTSQLVTRLQNYFGNQISVYHSRYSLHERVEVWNNVLNNSSKAKLILGARSSVLLPFNNLGLIIVDEEHELSYKQFDPAPRYHARDTSIVLANIFKAKTLLG
ncbi:MAG: DEAD/DEAH box helicase family protein, partial [Flavobacteriaceae bacterium]|nr:DEAD/DEAH box helicase family protein [Flavobacteriaceae bacterium]